jgi:hypothetical protein
LREKSGSNKKRTAVNGQKAKKAQRCDFMTGVKMADFEPQIKRVLID